MPKLRNNGPAYRGYDSGLGRLITVPTGGEVEVSEAKAEQLLRDFGQQWEVVPEEKAAEPERDKMVKRPQARKARRRRK